MQAILAGGPKHGLRVHVERHTMEFMWPIVPRPTISFSDTPDYDATRRWHSYLRGTPIGSVDPVFLYDGIKENRR